MQKEVNIFQNECPIPLNEVQNFPYYFMKMMPAIMEQDIEAFGYVSIIYRTSV
ncbi:MAG: hypothetical protein R2741_04190 [Methanolobus sp.]